MKSPWTLIGWLLAGLLALLISLGLYYLGRTMGWNPWLAPALLWAPLLIAAAVRLTGRLLSRPEARPVPVLDPSNPFTGQWEAIKSGLGEGSWELYLVVGGDDDGKRSFLSRALGQAEYQAAPAGPDGLSLRAADGRAWLNVPAALWYEQARAEASPAAGGDWAHLLKLLPGFPGRIGGLIVLADPGKIMADSETQSRILARKLGGLAGLPGPPPPWWLVLHPLESLASGRELESALRLGAEAGEEMWRRPFGLFFDQEDPDRTLSETMTQARTQLTGQLDRHLTKVDRSSAMPSLSGPVFRLRDELRRLPLNYFAAEIDGNKKAGRLKCDGLFLALEASQSPGQFSQLLLQNLIPGRRARMSGPAWRRPGRLIVGAAAIFFLIALAALVAGYWQGRRALSLAADVFPVLAQIERHPAAPPPVESLAAGTDLVLRLERQATGPARLYGAPNQAAAQARARLARQLNRHLPREYTQPAPFIGALAQWADQGAAPIVFKGPDHRVTIPGFATKAGREAVAELAAKWDAVLGLDRPRESHRVLSHYDLMIFAQWRKKAEDAALELETTPAKLRVSGSKGLHGHLASLEFLKTAGAELSFETWREIPGWIMAARELDLIDSLGNLGDLADDRRELAAVLQRIKSGGAPLGSDGVEKVIVAARAWKKYEAAVYGLSGLAESPQGLALLAEEMFSGAPTPPERASIAALRDLSAEALSALAGLAPIQSEPERELFERMFLSPVAWVTRSSTAAAALALEDQWNRKVVLPSKDLSEAEKAALLLGEDGAVAAFREGPARPYLTAGSKGYQPKEVFGEKFPWSGEFLKFINSSQEGWKKMAGSDGRLNVSARLRPVRAEGDRLSSHPLGVALEMMCEAESFRAETYNQPAAFKADWSPKTCEPLKITITFRDFKLTKIYEGSAGFTDFIKKAVSGELRFGPEDFPDQRHLMKAVGAEFVVVSLDISRGKEILKALTTPAPILKPPASIISADSGGAAR